jgi:23S rRNA pseudouridine2605 synthase
MAVRKKTTGQKRPVSKKKPAARKPAAKKPAARKPAARKPAARKPAARKPAGRSARNPATGTSGGRKVFAKKAFKVTPMSVVIETDDKIRLNRFLASSGICSRRAADELIRAGRVSLNGNQVQELGVRIDPMTDEVRMDEQVVVQERKVYVLFNKPKGVVCTNARNEQRSRVIDFLEKVKGRIYTIGRLDADSEGLILLTNDGDFAQEMAHPKYGVPKTYAVLVRGSVNPEELKKVRGGVWLSEGKTSGADIKIERRGRDKTYLKVTLREGKNREIRRIFAKLGSPVLTLKRVRIGGLTLHTLRSGKHRFLKPEELEDLRILARGEIA